MEDILDDPDTMREGIDAMTVAMLKEALKARGLKRTGLKADLKARLWRTSERSFRGPPWSSRPRACACTVSRGDGAPGRKHPRTTTR